MSDICRKVFEADLTRIEEVSSGALSKETFLEHYCHYTTVGEIIVGLPGALVEFSQLAVDARGLRLRHPAYFYVLLYHAAEEAEHTHVTWEHFTGRFGRDVLGTDGIRESATFFDRFLLDCATTMRLVAERLGVPLTADEVENLPMRQMFRSHMNRLLSRGADESLYLALRTDCIEAWDERWEPIFRDAVERSL